MFYISFEYQDRLWSCNTTEVTTHWSKLPPLFAVGHMLLHVNVYVAILDLPPFFPTSKNFVYLDYGNFKLTNQVARNEGSIFHSHLVSGIYSWPLAPSSGIYWDACC